MLSWALAFFVAPQMVRSQNATGENDNSGASEPSEGIVVEEPVTPNFDGTTIDENPYNYGEADGDDGATIIEESELPSLAEDPAPSVLEESVVSSEAGEQQAGESKEVPLPQMKLESVALPNEFSGAPHIAGSAGVLALGAAPSHYTIQEGDTLFDICDQLLDEPEYWPKLWSLNPEIRNPHFIWPGMVLRFYPGDDALPPYLEIEDEETLEPVMVEGEYLVEDLLKAPLPQDPTVVQAPPIRLAKMVEWHEVKDFPAESIAASELLGVKAVTAVQPMFVHQERLEPLAEISDTFHGETTIQQEGVLEGVGAGVSEGQEYSVLRYEHRIKHPDHGSHVGYQYQNVGTLRVTKMFSEQGKALFQAQKTWFYLQKGDVIVERVSSLRRIPQVSGPAGDAQGTVVSFALPSKEIAGTGEFIVVDNPSLSVGSYVPLYRRRGRDGDHDDVLKSLEDTYRYGVARVVDTSDGGAIAYVMSTRMAVEIGDRTSQDIGS